MMAAAAFVTLLVPAIMAFSMMMSTLMAFSVMMSTLMAFSVMMSTVMAFSVMVPVMIAARFRIVFQRAFRESSCSLVCRTLDTGI